MTGIELLLRQPITGVLDASSIKPLPFGPQGIGEVEQLTVEVSGQQVSLADLFQVRATSASAWVVQGDLPSSIRWGYGLKQGELIIEGNVGNEVGTLMQGGNLLIRGNVGNYLACGMRRGQIVVQGHAQDFVGGALPGQRRGMSGGNVIVRGNVGDRAGDRMRRGTLIVGGNVGDYCASRMIAGTIAIWGTVGSHLGIMMRRGTVWAPQLDPSMIPLSFSQPQVVLLPHLMLWYRSLLTQDERFNSFVHREPMVTRWFGDLGSQGLGEIVSPI